MIHRTFNVDVRDGKNGLGADGGPLRARSFGLKVGYWPCFSAPYVELAWNTKRYAAWYGLANYAESAACGITTPGTGTGPRA